MKKPMKEYNNLDEYFDDLKADVRKYIQNSAKYTVCKFRDELADAAYKAIDDFYNDYEPVDYYRNYTNFKKFPNKASKLVKKIYYARFNYYYVGGIELSNEHMEDFYSREVKSGPNKGETVGTLDQVYYSVVEQGYHGLPIVGTPQMKVSPLDFILNKKEKLEKKKNKYIKEATEKAAKDEYNILFRED